MLGNLSHMAHNPANRGYHAVYREHEVNHCPGCGRTHWYIGRVSAECAFCATALPMENTLSQNDTKPVVLRFGRGGGKVS